MLRGAKLPSGECLTAQGPPRAAVAGKMTGRKAACRLFMALAAEGGGAAIRRLPEKHGVPGIPSRASAATRKLTGSHAVRAAIMWFPVAPFFSPAPATSRTRFPGSGECTQRGNP